MEGTEQNSAAPVVDSTGGQGADGNGGASEGGEFGGFESLDALVSAHQGATSQLETFKTQLQNLESLKGRQGNEIGTLRQQIATLTGHIEGMKSAIPARSQGPTIDDIAHQLKTGEIDEGQAIKLAHELATTDAETRLGKKFEERLKNEIGTLKQEAAFEKYKTNYLKENPGYEEAFNTGKLNQWLSQGMPGEDAWLHFQLNSTKEELKSLKDKANAGIKAAEEKGIDKGIQLQKGSAAAGKVLSGRTGQFSQSGNKYDLNDTMERNKAAKEHLQKLRGG